MSYRLFVVAALVLMSCNEEAADSPRAAAGCKKAQKTAAAQCIAERVGKNPSFEHAQGAVADCTSKSPACRAALAPWTHYAVTAEASSDIADDDLSVSASGLVNRWQGGVFSRQSDAGDVTVTLGSDGKATLDYSFGDADGTARATLSLPVDAGVITAADGTYGLTLDGGEHASGLFGVDAALTLRIFR